jgi:hypothetical protein
VSYVLPSKIQACIESGKRILYVGSLNSDVHLLANAALPPDRYQRVDVGDVNALVNVLHMLEDAIVRERKPKLVRIDRSKDVGAFPPPGIATQRG